MVLTDVDGDIQFPFMLRREEESFLKTFWKICIRICLTAKHLIFEMKESKIICFCPCVNAWFNGPSKFYRNEVLVLSM